MSDNEPYENEREAHAAAVAAVPPEDGWTILRKDGCEELLHGALHAAGVETSAYEDGTITWMATHFEDSVVATIARWIAQAAEPEPGAVTEWALAYTHRPDLPGVPVRRILQRYPDEADARESVEEIRRLAPQDEPALMSREVGPWKEVNGG